LASAATLTAMQPSRAARLVQIAAASLEIFQFQRSDAAARVSALVAHATHISGEILTLFLSHSQTA